MPYTQAIPFNQSKAGKVPKFCERNTRLGYVSPAYPSGLPNTYDSAWENWEATDQHTGQPPLGIDAPVFFSYLSVNDGHVGVRLANGKFWSDGDTYDSIPAYEANHAPRYVGYSTHLEGIPVIREGATMQLTPTEVDMLFKMCLGRPATEAELNSPDYQKSASVLTHTLWNNGGEARYENPTPGTATVLKPGNYKVN